MNIPIYYYNKIICLHQQNQWSQNQVFKNLDSLSKEELKQVFEKFIQQNDEQQLDLETNDLTLGIEKFKRVFHYIPAAGGLIEKDDKYLFIRRFQKWDLPKGKLDKGETPDVAAIRECEEECGINKLSIRKLLLTVYHMYDYKDSYALKQTWWYAMQSAYAGVLKPQLEEHIDRVEWFDTVQIHEIALQNTYPAIKDVLKEADLI